MYGKTRGKIKMQWLLLWGSFQRRKMRVMAAILAVVLGSSMVTAFLGVAMDISGKLGRELRAYGANILVVPKGGDLAAEGAMPDVSPGATPGATLREAALSLILTGPAGRQIVGAAPYLYAVVSIKSGAGDPQKVVLAGARFEEVKKVSPWWRVEGVEKPGEDQGESRSDVVIGSEVARKLRLRPGDPLFIGISGGKEEHFTVSGVVRTGGPEDDQVFMDLDVVQRLAGRPGEVSLIQVSALTDRVPLQKTVGLLAGALPDGQVKVLNQVAMAESRLLGKLTWLMALVAVLVLLAAALSVTSTMTATVLERTREIGVMKALGAENRRVAQQFFQEAGLIGLAGGVAGLPLGFAAAQAIGKTVFSSAIGINLMVIPISLVVAVGVALLAGRGPVSRAVSVEPAVTLRGE